MKRILPLLSVIFLSSTILPRTVSAQADVYVSYQTFYDELSPFGQWISDPQYGYVWVPNLDDDFRPYFTGGHWIMTDFGNTWYSEYSWGWACFHYGRWVYNDYYGWVWVPGYEWGPGWVAWTWGDGFCGWAPLYPGIVWAGVGYTCPDDWWVLMHPKYLYRPRYLNHWRTDFIHGPHHTHTILQRAHFITNTYEGNGGKYYAGPRAAEVTKVTHQSVPVFHLENVQVKTADHIIGNVVNIYHPSRIEITNRDGNNPIPAHVIPAPKPVSLPENVRTNWDQPRPFKTDIQRETPGWNRPFIRNSPPYEPAEPARGRSVEPARQPDYHTAPPISNPPARVPSSAPAPRRR